MATRRFESQQEVDRRNGGSIRLAHTFWLCPVAVETSPRQTTPSTSCLVRRRNGKLLLGCDSGDIVPPFDPVAMVTRGNNPPLGRKIVRAHFAWPAHSLYACLSGQLALGLALWLATSSDQLWCNAPVWDRPMSESDLSAFLGGSTVYTEVGARPHRRRRPVAREKLVPWKPLSDR